MAMRRPQPPAWHQVPGFKALLAVGFSRRLLYAWSHTMAGDAGHRLARLHGLHDRLVGCVDDAVAWFELPLLTATCLTPEMLIDAGHESAVVAAVEALATGEAHRIPLLLDLYVPAWQTRYPPAAGWNWVVSRDVDGELSITSLPPE